MCHSCMHKNGSLNFHQALQRLENASKLETLETAASGAYILCNTPLLQMKAEELLFGRSSPDIVARDI